MANYIPRLWRILLKWLVAVFINPGRIMQLIPSGLGDKSQCADAAGLLWQPRWLGSPLHFDKMSSGHGSVHCLLLFIFFFSFFFCTFFAYVAWCCLLNVVQTTQESRELWQKGEKTPHVNWRQARSIRPSELALRNLQPEPSSHVQTTSLLHPCESVWYTLFGLEIVWTRLTLSAVIYLSIV